MYKKLLSVLLACSMITAMLHQAAAADVTETNDTEMNFLAGVGGFDSVKNNPNDTVTRGEFAAIIADALRLDSGADMDKWNNAVYGDDMNDTAVSDTSSGFTDVPEVYPYYNEIYTVVRKGYMKGISESAFAPEHNILLQEASKAIVDMLGYKNYVLQYGGYPAGYRMLASELGITKGISKDFTDTLTQSDLAKIIYNAVNVPVMETKMLSTGNMEYVKSDNETFLTYVMRLDKINTVMTDNGITSFYGESTLGHEFVKLDDKKVRIDEKREYTRDLIGRNVTAYVDNEDEDDIELIYAYANGKDNTDKFDVLDFVSYNQNEISFDDNTKVRTRKIQDNAGLILNGVAVDGFNEDTFKFDYGDVTLISDSNSYVRLIIVNDIDYVYVKSIDADNKLIYDRIVNSDKRGAPLDLSENGDFEYINIRGNDGSKKAFSDIAEGSILSVISNGNYISVTVLDSVQTEIEVKSVYDEDGKKYISDGINEYRISRKLLDSAYKPEIRSGRNYSLNLVDNYVIWIADKSDSPLTGFVIQSCLDDENEDSIIIKIITTNGEITKFNTAEKIKTVDGEGTNSNIKSGVLFDKYLNGYRGIIQYTLNENNKIKSVEFPADKQATTQLHKIFESYSSTTHEYYSRKYRRVGDGFGGQMYMNSDTVFIATPESGGSDSDYYITNKNIFENNSSYPVIGYTTSANSRIAQYIIVKMPIDSENPYMETQMRFVAVDSVTTELNEDDEVIQKVTGTVVSRFESIQRIELISLYDREYDGKPCSAFENVPDSLLSSTNGKRNLYDIKPGDIIRCTNKNGQYAEKVELVYRTFTDNVLSPDGRRGALMGSTGYLEKNVDGSDKAGGNPYQLSTNNLAVNGARWFIDPSYRVCLGYAIKNESGIVHTTTMDLTNPRNKLENMDKDKYISEAVKTSSIITMTVDGKKVSTKKGTVNDIKCYEDAGTDCSKVLYISNTGSIIYMIVINDIGK